MDNVVGVLDFLSSSQKPWTPKKTQIYGVIVSYPEKLVTYVLLQWIPRSAVRFGISLLAHITCLAPADDFLICDELFNFQDPKCPILTNIALLNDGDFTPAGHQPVTYTKDTGE
ncbi:hypothetical protein FBUS_05481 [Fasciolopsis buskii]|uniref:Uncharacterized protein n=1 Tax=Fasciolopsis buskii TaxID=27845 RepID=A0A8E0RIR3_9TREM|nr:hypothetical protein FBUS_05481 [Fasciolopsis buski]